MLYGILPTHPHRVKRQAASGTLGEAAHSARRNAAGRPYRNGNVSMRDNHFGGRTLVSRGRRSRIVLWAIAAVAFAGVVAFVPTAMLTDRATFCKTCHEMVPYYDAWAAGKHADGATCIDCHVAPGLPARLAHKFVALGEVRAHFAGDTTFPRPTPAEVPNARCTRCHTDMTKTTKGGFSHTLHAKKGSCADCHASTGHDVTTAVLQAAGIFNPNSKRAVIASSFAAVDAGKANLTGHKKVACSRCHDMAKTGCARCHEAKHKPNYKPVGDCPDCHRPGDKFVFVHPGSADCAACHKLPQKHFRPVSGALGTCVSCHAKGGGSWKFAHPGVSSDCSACHTAPAGHYAGQCSACHHDTGKSFAFRHPSSGEHSWKGQACVTCHPKSFTSASCTCHGGRAPKGD